MKATLPLSANRTPGPGRSFRPSAELEALHANTLHAIGLAPDEPYLAMHMRLGDVFADGSLDTTHEEDTAHEDVLVNGSLDTRFWLSSEEKTELPDTAHEKGKKEWTGLGDKLNIKGLENRHDDDANEALDKKFVQCASRMQASLPGGAAHDLPLFVASDNEGAKARVSKHEGTRRIKFVPRSNGSNRMGHVDRMGALLGTQEGHRVHMMAWVEILILAGAKCMVISNSGYSRLAVEWRADIFTGKACFAKFTNTPGEPEEGGVCNKRAAYIDWEV